MGNRRCTLLLSLTILLVRVSGHMQGSVSTTQSNPALRKSSANRTASAAVVATRRLSSLSSWLIVNTVGSIVGDDPITMFGTAFTADNYQRDMIDFLLAGLKDDNGVAMQNWYLQGTNADAITPGLVREGPGPNTKTHLGFHDVADLLSQYPAKISNGTLERGNELGAQVLGGGAWPETPGGLKSIALGQTVPNHAFVRPILANTLDKGSWSDTWLGNSAKEFFATRNELSSADVSLWVIEVLHKVHLNLDIDDTQAKEFATYMTDIIQLIPFTEATLSNTVVDYMLSVQDTLAKKASYLESTKAAIKSKYANDLFVKNDDAEKLNLLASVMLDSMQFAGGISVPTVLKYVLALTHMDSDNKHASLKTISLDESNYEWILWETLRKYAPVGSAPSWEKQDNGQFKHVVPNVAQALMDSSIFENPLDFKNRGADLYAEKLQGVGLPWAGPAVQRFSDGTADTALPHSHNCPAQDLSFRMMKAFITAFIAKGGPTGWAAADSSSITVTSYGASDFTLLKRGLTYKTGWAMFILSCKDGYEWVATEWSWGYRRWTCKVQ